MKRGNWLCPKCRNLVPYDRRKCPFCGERRPAEQSKEGAKAMRYVEAPHKIPKNSHPNLFLAGGITGCPDWQAEAVVFFRDLDVTILNPRRKNFPIHDAQAARGQIEWEHHALRWADGILFWFPCETLCPIVLYELGAWSMTAKPLFVGVHRDYQRVADVQIQTSLARPDVEVVFDFAALISMVRSWAKSLSRTKESR